VLGAQAAVALMIPVGNSQATVDATLTGPRGNALSLERTDSVTSVGDLAPRFSLA